MNNKSVSITIVTVVYNSENLIEKTLASVAEQTYPLEFVVVDGGSTDKTLNIISKYQSTIAKFVSEKDKGIYDAMNKAVGLASGEWICFLNSGDVFVDDKSVEKMAASIASANYPDIIYGDIYTESAEGLKLKVAKEPCNLHRMYFCHQASFSRKKLLEMFPFDLKYKMSADFNFFKICYKKGFRFVHAHFPVVVYDKTGISNSAREKGLRENIEVVKSLDKPLEKYVFLLKLYFVIYWRKLTKKS